MFDSTAAPGKPISKTRSGFPASGDRFASRMARRRSRRIARNAMLVILAAVLCAYGLTLALRSPALAVKEIRITGLESCDAQVILESAGLSDGENMLQVLLFGAAGARARILEDCSFIKKAGFVPGFKGVLTLRLRERKPVAAIEQDGVRYYLGEDGMLFQNPFLDNPSGLVVLTGMNIDPNKSLQNLETTHAYKLDVWRRLMREINLADQSANAGFSQKITGIGLQYSERPEVIVDGRIIVDFGGLEDMQRKILLFMEAYHEYLGNAKGYFVFTESNKGDFRPE